MILDIACTGILFKNALSDWRQSFCICGIIFCMDGLISIGKIINFHGIAGEARVGYSSAARLESAKKVKVKDRELTIEKLRFHKNFAIVKFAEISDINELLNYKGQSIYLEKEKVKETLEEEEYLIDDLVGLNVFDDKDDFIGTVESVAKSAGNDILSIKPQDERYGNVLIPFAAELVPVVDIKAKKIIINPIKGLLPWD